MQANTNTPTETRASAKEIAKRVPSARRGSAHLILVNGVLTHVTRAEYVEYLQRERARIAGNNTEARS